MLWNRFTEGSAAEPSLTRAKDGTLHLVWRSGAKLYHGTLTGPPTVIGEWDASLSEPWLIAVPDGSLAVVFATKADLYTAKSKDGGGTWEVTSAPAPTGAFAATGDKEGKPFITASADVGGKADRVAVVMDGESSEGWAAWHEPTGLFAKAVKPPTGAAQPAPGSRLAPTQRLALSPRIGAPGVYLAYCGGSPAMTEVKLWNTRGGEALTVVKAPGARHPWIAPAPEGRLWVLWVNRDNTISAVRSNKAIMRFSKPYVLTGAGAVRSLLGDGATGPLDVVANASHTRVLPELELKTTPEGVRVSDLGDPVEGVQVEIDGKTFKSDVKGLAAWPIAAGTVPVVKATHAAYAPATIAPVTPVPARRAK
jgi:hypothetical protein